VSLRSVRGALATGFAGASLVLCALAVGAAPLLVPGLGLLVLAVLASLIVAWSAHTTVLTRTGAPTRVEEGEPFEVGLRLARRPFDLAQVEVFDPLAGPRAQPVPPARSGGELQMTVRLAARGRHRLPPPELVTADPLGLVRRRDAARTEQQEILVLPRVEPVRWLGRGRRGGDPGGEAGGAHAADPIGAGDLDGLRPYRHGAPASRIHWATLARGAGLMERRLRPDGDGWPLVVLDGRGATGDAELDTVVRSAASLMVALARRGGARLSLPGERRALAVGPDLAAWPAVHARLALLERPTARQPPGLSGAASAGLVLYVAARMPSRLPALRGARSAVLVVPDTARAPGGRRVLATGACHGYELGAQLAGVA
jgi:uncharacterized protein (DUF58 family)